MGGVAQSSAHGPGPTVASRAADLFDVLHISLGAFDSSLISRRSRKMICSVPAGKSGSNWLDRLRSTKGFPTGPDVGLDDFLSAPDPSISEPIQPVQHRAAASQPPPAPGAGGDGWYGIMTNVLSELFHMGEPDPIPAKRGSRKQANPRFFHSSRSGADRKDGNALSFSSDNNLVGKAVVFPTPGEDEEGEGEKEELVGYSRSEVTVIDTSCSGWKFEKVLFRRKSVWKVRDRKGKGRSGLGRKKRRASGGGGDEAARVKKKLKPSSPAFDSSNEGQDATHSRKREVCKNTVDNLSRGPRMRFPVSGSPTKLRNGSSSVVLIKGIPAGKKKKADVLRSSTRQ